MNKIILLFAMIAALAISATAAAGNGHGKAKVTICHKGTTLSVGAPAVKAHLKHGDKLGACISTPPPGGDDDGGPGTPGAGDPVVTPTTFPPVSRVLVCASKPVFRAADGSLGISADLTVNELAAGTFAGATLTIARYYPGVGATCDNLGGTFTGKYLDGYAYPIWNR